MKLLWFSCEEWHTCAHDDARTPIFQREQTYIHGNWGNDCQPFVLTLLPHTSCTCTGMQS